MRKVWFQEFKNICKVESYQQFILRAGFCGLRARDCQSRGCSEFRHTVLENIDRPGQDKDFQDQVLEGPCKTRRLLRVAQIRLPQTYLALSFDDDDRHSSGRPAMFGRQGLVTIPQNNDLQGTQVMRWLFSGYVLSFQPSLL